MSHWPAPLVPPCQGIKSPSDRDHRGSRLKNNDGKFTLTRFSLLTFRILDSAVPNRNNTEATLPSKEVLDLVRYSCSELPEGSSELGASLYRNLFQMSPDLRDMFGSSNLEEQRQRMADALLRVIHHLDDPDQVARYLRSLGSLHHVHLGVRPEHYPHIGRAMVRAVSDVSPTWSSSMSSAWVVVYRWITAHMVAGAEIAVAAKQAAEEGAATAEHTARSRSGAHRVPAPCRADFSEAVERTATPALKGGR